MNADSIIQCYKTWDRLSRESLIMMYGDVYFNTDKTADQETWCVLLQQYVKKRFNENIFPKSINELMQ